MTDKRTFALGGALLAGLLAVGALAPAASATEEQEEPETVCGTFQLRGATGKYPEVTFGPAPAGSSVVDASTVVLKKPTEGEDPGVEFAAFDLDVDVDTSISVEYALADGATPDAAAVRLFYFTAAGADTVLGSPAGVDHTEAGDPATGTLTILTSGHVGTLGMVYDASNASAGTVTFTNLKIDGNPVSFEPEVCATPSPSASATAGPSASPSVGASRSPVGALPVTGTNNLGVIVGVGASLILAGAAALVLLRVRRRYEA
jgi:LPXTG-motif cell wall-anchored protein